LNRILRHRIGLPLLAAIALSVAGTCIGAGSAHAYNGGSAASYADQYALSYNSAWNSFPDDCTNFASQALYAGGEPMTANTGSVTDDHYWFDQYFTWPYPGWVHTNSWSVAGDLWQFLYNTGRGSHWYTYGPAAMGWTDGLYPGDLLFYNWDGTGAINHAAVQTSYGYDENGNPSDRIDQHTNNRYHVNWTLFSYNQQWNTTLIYAIHIN
jgi:hypothetical protein